MQPTLALLAALAVAGCAADTRTGNRSPINTAYRCSDGKTPVVRYLPDGSGSIRLDDQRAIDLTRAGATLSGSGVVLREESNEVTLSVDGAAAARCREVG